MSKTIDRHVETETMVFRVRIPVDDIAEITRIANKHDKTKGAVIREAVRLFLESK